jgi:hypothetical protein
MGELRALAAAPQPSIGVLRGRRRVGKTFLLEHAWSQKRLFYFLAADSTPELNRADLVRDLAAWSGRDLKAEDYPSWRTVFRALLDLARTDRLVVVLDEFQYLLGDDDAASQLVAVWDRDAAGHDVTLLLCGSEISTMQALSAPAAPLRGRIRWQQKLSPFDYYHAARLLARPTPRDAARFYAAS